jgi:hypothetical protein
MSQYFRKPVESLRGAPRIVREGVLRKAIQYMQLGDPTEGPYVASSAAVALQDYSDKELTSVFVQQGGVPLSLPPPPFIYLVIY